MKKISWMNKPCRACGVLDRGPGGKCRPCARKSEELKRRLNGIQERCVYDGPCKKCGSTNKNTSGTCVECAAEYGKEYYKKNKDRLNTASLLYFHKNKEQIYAYQKKWNSENKKKCLGYYAKWKNNNPEAYKEIKRRWREENSDAVRTYCVNRRRMLQASGKISKDIAKRLMVLQKSKCVCCGTRIDKEYHLDHNMPIALGGSNTDDNIQLLCKSCNLKKHAKHPVDYMQSLGYLL